MDYFVMPKFFCCFGSKLLTPDDFLLNSGSLREKKLLGLIKRLPNQIEEPHIQAWKAACEDLSSDNSNNGLILVVQNLLNLMWCLELKDGRYFGLLMQLFLSSSQYLSVQERVVNVNNFVDEKREVVELESQSQVENKQQARLYLLQLRFWKRLCSDCSVDGGDILAIVISSASNISSGGFFDKDFFRILVEGNKVDRLVVELAVHLCNGNDQANSYVLTRAEYIQSFADANIVGQDFSVRKFICDFLPVENEKSVENEKRKEYFKGFFTVCLDSCEGKYKQHFPSQAHAQNRRLSKAAVAIAPKGESSRGDDSPYSSRRKAV